MPRIGDTLTRLLFLGGSVAALGLLTLRPEADRDWSSARAEPPISNSAQAAPQKIEPQWVEAIPTAYHETPSVSPVCNSWDVSPMAMEAILDEMIRRGWQPPTQGEYLAGLYVDGAVAAMDPDAAIPLDSPRDNPLLTAPATVEGAEAVKVEDWLPLPNDPAQTYLPAPEPAVDSETVVPDAGSGIGAPSEPSVDSAPTPVDSLPEAVSHAP